MRCLTSLVILVVCCLKCMAQTIINPVFDRTDNYVFHVDKIELTADSTYLFCTYSAEANSWANISPETYIEEISTGKKYTIVRSEGLPYAPYVRNFLYVDRCNVKLIFPRLLNKDTKLNLIEIPSEKAFNIYGISLKEVNDETYNDVSLERAIALTSKADFYGSIGNYAKAIEFEKQAMHIKKAKVGRLNELYEYSVSMLGHYLSMKGDYEKAENYLIEDLELRRFLHGEKHEMYTLALQNLANCYVNQDRIVDAISLYEETLTIQEDNLEQGYLECARTKSLLSDSYWKIGDIPKALKYKEEAVSIMEQKLDEDDEEYIYSMLSLAQIYLYAGKEEVVAITKKLINIIERDYGKENKMYLIAINFLCSEKLLSHKHEEALTYAVEGLEIARKMFGESSIEYGMTLKGISQVYGISGDYNKAILYELKSQKILENWISADSYANSQSYVAEYYSKMNDFDNAVKYKNRAIDILNKRIIPEFEKMTSLQKYTYWQKRHFIFDSGYVTYVYNYMTDETLSELYNNILLFKGITLKDGKNEKADWKEIQYSLGNNDIAVEFLSSHEQDSLFCYYALIINKHCIAPKLVKLFDISQFGDLLNKSISFFEKKIELGKIIWNILEQESVPIENVYFSPSGIFHSIAIEYLPIDDVQNYSDKYNMYRLSSTEKLIHVSPTIHYKDAVLYGGLDYNLDTEETDIERSGFDFLSYTEEEVDSISKILKNNSVKAIVYKGIEGTESVFKNLSNSPIDILHLSTHGRTIKSSDVGVLMEKDNLRFLQQNIISNFAYEDDVMSRAYIVLSGGNRLPTRTNIPMNDEDGILTAKEISSLKFEKLDLVVLSACETAEGELAPDETILGLPKGFKRAGANTILMSLGRVNDEATKILMVEFYKNLMGGKGKHQSLKDAQKYLRSVDNGKYDKPKYWASFIMLDGLN